MEMVLSAATNMAVSFALSALFGPSVPDQFGPRLSDLRSQVPSTGNTINKVFGNPRITGRVIYASAKRETAHTTSQGKGGGGGSQTTYSYAMDFAISFGAVQSMGIGKIWLNKKLVYNSRAADFATKRASVLFAQYFKLYPGSETQLPDPTLEAALGVGNVPAYRGQSYLVFSNLQLAPYYNNIPTVEVELITSGTYVPTLTLDGSAGSAQGALFTPSGVGTITSGNYTSLATGFIYSGNSIFSTSSPTAPRLVGTVPVALPSGIPYVSNHMYYRGSNSYGYVQRWNISSPSAPVALSNITTTGAPYAVTGRYNFIFAGGSIGVQTFLIYGVNLTASLQHVLTTVPVDNGSYMECNDLYLLVANPATSKVYICGGVAAGVPGLLSSITLTNPYFATISGSYLYVGGAFGLKIYDFTDPTLPVLLSTYNPAPSFVVWGVAIEGNYAYVSASDGTWSTVFVVDITTKTAPAALTSYAGNISSGSVLISGGRIYSGYSTTLNITSYSNPLTSTAATLSTMVTDICSAVGVTNINVSQLTDLIDGYVIGAQMSARAALEQLQKAYYFDAVDSDNTIKFVKRGSITYTSIAEDDLVIDGSKPPCVALNRVQEVDLPKVVNVMFYNSDNAYQQGKQHAIKQITTSKQILDLTLPIYISDAKGKQIADVNMYMAWSHRNALTFTTTRKYAYLDPTDPIQIAKANGTTYTLLPTRRIERPSGVVDWECLADDPNIYSQTAIAGALLTVPISTVAGIANTIYELLDIPIVRDVDDYSGMYTAANGDTGWIGGGLHKSLDGGATFIQQQSLPYPGAVIGSTASVLGNFLGKFVFDESSSVVITLLSGTLSSVTRTQILNGTNAAIIGNEIVQFRDATLTATNTYTLTGFLRGLFGTEQYISTHAGYERFVLLNTATIQRLTMQLAETGLDRLYKGVSNGQLFSDVNAITFNCANNGLKPLSPVAIGAGRDSAGNITIKWKRRARIGGSWMNFVDAQLGETTESYSIDIMSGAVVVRTLTSATTTVAYTAAQELTDFGFMQNTLTVNIYQISSTVGRGFAGNATISLRSTWFFALGQTVRAWCGIAAHQNGNVYAVVNAGNIYMQTGGTGNFVSLAQTVRNWLGIAVHPNGNVYATDNLGDIYLQSSGSGNFIALGQTSREWMFIACHQNGNVYATVTGASGDIFMQTGGTGNFVSLAQTTRLWHGVAVHPNGNVYATVKGGDIYMQTAGAGNFIALGQTVRNWVGITCKINGDVLAVDTNGDVYMQTAGAGNFIALSQTVRAWYGIGAKNNTIYATVLNGDIYKQENSI